MAWTQTDLDTIEAAVVNPEARVRFSDGREVQYRSVTEILAARDVIKSALSGVSGGIRTTKMKFTKD